MSRFLHTLFIPNSLWQELVKFGEFRAIVKNGTINIGDYVRMIPDNDSVAISTIVASVELVGDKPTYLFRKG